MKSNDVTIAFWRAWFNGVQFCARGSRSVTPERTAGLGDAPAPSVQDTDSLALFSRNHPSRVIKKRHIHIQVSYNLVPPVDRAQASARSPFQERTALYLEARGARTAIDPSRDLGGSLASTGSRTEALNRA